MKAGASAGGRRSHNTNHKAATDGDAGKREDGGEPALALEPDQADQVASGLHRLLDESLAFSEVITCCEGGPFGKNGTRRSCIQNPEEDQEELLGVRMFRSVPEGEPCVVRGKSPTGLGFRALRGAVQTAVTHAVLRAECVALSHHKPAGSGDPTGLPSGDVTAQRGASTPSHQERHRKSAEQSTTKAPPDEGGASPSSDSDSDLDSDDEEEAARMAAIASCAVSGATITASAKKSAKAAAQALQGSQRPTAREPQPTAEAAALLEASGELETCREAGVVVSGGSYIALVEDEDKPLEGALAVKLTEQLHSIIARGLQPQPDNDTSVGSDSDSDSCSDSDSGSGSDSDTSRGHKEAKTALAGETEEEPETCGFVRMFRQVTEGEPCQLSRLTGPASEHRWPSWATALDDEVGGSSSDEEKIVKAVQSVVEDPQRIIQRAARLTEEAAAHVAEAIHKVDSDDDSWRGGVKPGSSIERKGGGGARAGARGWPLAESEGAKQKRKRKGKKERQREAVALTDGQEDVVTVGEREGQRPPGLVGEAAGTGVGAETEEEKLERKRTKRREIKKRRKQQVQQQQQTSVSHQSDGGTQVEEEERVDRAPPATSKTVVAAA